MATCLLPYLHMHMHTHTNASKCSGLLCPLPCPAQATLQAAYKQELSEGYGIVFNKLFCLNNMPIKRFADFLVRGARGGAGAGTARGRLACGVGTLGLLC